MFLSSLMNLLLSDVHLDNVLRWEKAVKDDEEELEIARMAEQKQQLELEKLMKEIEELKSRRLLHKSEVDKMEDAISQVITPHILLFVPFGKYNQEHYREIQFKFFSFLILL